ncbi:MAG TPA: ATP-binding protein, partial [Anaerolineaceae bacterium]|nr:ATP-binding protein [Anaerolineaceae bacterium]
IQEKPDLARRAIHAGMSDFLCPPLKAEELLAAIQNTIASMQRRREAVLQEDNTASAGLQRQVSELETLSLLGRSITSSLDIDSVLTTIVDAAVRMTGAEEGSLLLLDEKTGELYVRAARNFNDDFVRTFRLPIQDTLAGSVLRTGQPVLLDEKAPQKIKTSYLVHSLLYVPLQIHGHVFGVLGIDNRRQRMTFTEHHVRLLETMADYAVIAIENARLFANVNSERAKLETILTRTQDGVILIDTQQRLELVNSAAQAAFQLDAVPFEGRPFAEIFTQREMLELVQTSASNPSNRIEVPLPDGRVMLALLTHIPDIGQAITLHDITYLKKLDRIKSDFVSTVSHDLRSPLTAVLGYVELIERAGPTTEMQREFIRRVQGSVHNITTLVDDLVNLGRIEAGFDTRKEPLQLERIVRYSADGFKKLLAEKGDTLVLELPDDLPPVYANPVQMRQVVDHLMDNAIKYTPAGGTITIQARMEEKQLIIHFRDTGIGIPPADLPFIFDKFYRSSNASAEASGTGLGLAIVKSVIDSHQGRIWVDSAQNKGAVFTIVLPVMES